MQSPTETWVPSSSPSLSDSEVPSLSPTDTPTKTLSGAPTGSPSTLPSHSPPAGPTFPVPTVTPSPSPSLLQVASVQELRLEDSARRRKDVSLILEGVLRYKRDIIRFIEKSH